ncbi:MAG: hypothetical protein ACXVLK_15385, partial [Acidimicrobiales bacterium]
MDYDLPEELTVQAEGPIRTLTINRPDELNAVNQALHWALAHVWRLQHQKQETALRPDPRVKSKRAKPPGGALAIVFAIAGGIALSTFPRILAEATDSENGLAPYSALLLLAVGALLTSPFFVLFFITFPVVSTAGMPSGYLAGSKRQHVLGLAGGV